MIAKTRSYIFRWRSRFHRRRVCSLIWLAEGRKTIFLHVLHGSYYFLRRHQTWNNLTLIKDIFLFILSSLHNFFLPSIGPPQPPIVFFCHKNIGRRVEGEVPVCPLGRFLIFHQISVMHSKIKRSRLTCSLLSFFRQLGQHIGSPAVSWLLKNITDDINHIWVYKYKHVFADLFPAP